MMQQVTENTLANGSHIHRLKPVPPLTSFTALSDCEGSFQQPLQVTSRVDETWQAEVP